LSHQRAQKALWAPLGSPGAVLVDGEVAGAWRASQAGRERLELTEADRVGAVRGASRVMVRLSD
jgi:hypothetical protein